MLSYEPQYRSIKKSPSELIGAFAEVIDRSDKHYLIASVATACGPSVVAQAAINTYIHLLSDIVKDDALYESGFIDVYKRKIKEIIEWLNLKIFDTGERLQVQPMMSLTAVGIDADGQASFCQVGNTFAVFCQSEKTILATRPMTSDYDYSKAGMQTYHEDKLTITALGTSRTVFPHFTKTKITEDSDVFLLSSGFSRNMSRTINTFNTTATKSALSDVLMKEIEQARSIACTDAVLSIHPIIL